MCESLFQAPLGCTLQGLKLGQGKGRGFGTNNTSFSLLRFNFLSINKSIHYHRISYPLAFLFNLFLFCKYSDINLHGPSFEILTKTFLPPYCFISTQTFTTYIHYETPNSLLADLSVLALVASCWGQPRHSICDSPKAVAIPRRGRRLLGI
jgi:hypothetical protein